ncbi:RNA-binding transcriptional accessory protein [Arhodomonas aquaeolei]|nr:Tex family protein [Arhodomonas aquaeolei]MCS4504822.1 RNA-binding transcriptional accessory protein [Arhodomonas aquaeolei]
MSVNIPERIARDIDAAPRQVEAAVRLLDEGATVPFIARYRKEATGGLDDGQLRELERRLVYLRELEERRATVLAAIEEQGKLSDALRASIEAATTKQRLEDLYLPYRKKRRTKGEIARAAGLEPLADALLADPGLDPATAAADYVDAEAGVADTDAALEGARYILAERFAEDAELIAGLRDYAWREGVLVSEVDESRREDGVKFSDYFDHREPLHGIPSHRALALFRGRREGVLRLRLAMPDELAEERTGPGRGEGMIAERFDIRHAGRAADDWLAGVVRFTWRVKLLTRLETDLLGSLRENAEAEAIEVFARNLHDLLLAAPAGPRAVMGVDPGLRTGCKVAVVDATGKLVDTATIYPHAPQKRWDEALAALDALVRRHGVALVAVGNGTASRETERLVTELRQGHGGLASVLVSEAGASVYSASETAAREFPDLDVSLRGAVSIARRLQDPLAELVKIDPKSIGVGQYQHDVSQLALARKLDAVVEDCVNAVGVDLNTASAALLARVSGLTTALAERIVEHRDGNGPFPDRKSLMAVPRFGAKTFEQAAGFLRIRDGDQPLDASAVHPEAYPVVERILTETGGGIAELIGNSELLGGLDPAKFTDERFGLPTVTDILAELDKPGRDPRPAFRTATFREGVERPEDLEPGMVLEGTVTNVTNFGAFVDVGVHQDGLVHISAMASRFVRDPREVCRPGDVVRVKVIDVDLQRRRIGLSMRLDDEAGSKAGRDQPAGKPGGAGKGKGRGRGGRRDNKPEPRPETAMGAAFAALQGQRDRSGR